jgi:hypothetical protein
LDGKKATLDHVVPKAKGGLTVKENLIPACLACNAIKQHADWLEWFRSQPFHSEAGEDAIRSWLKT